MSHADPSFPPPTLSITSDQVNYLVYRYLLESGFVHSTFTFYQEAAIPKLEIKGALVKPGTLIAFLQKGLQYTEVETHINEDGSEKRCSAPFSLVSPHKCALSPHDSHDAVRRRLLVRQQPPSAPPASLSQQQSPAQSTLLAISTSTTPNPIKQQQSTQQHSSSQHQTLPNQKSLTGDRVGGADSDKEPNTTHKREREKSRKSDQGLQNERGGKRVKREAEISSPIDVIPPTKQQLHNNMDGVALDSVGPSDHQHADKMAVDLLEGPDALTIHESSVTRLIGHQGDVFVCCWNSQYSPLLATGSADGTVRIWNVPDRPGQPVQLPLLVDNSEGKTTATGQNIQVTQMDWNSSGDKLATGAVDGTGRIWSRQGVLLHRLQRHADMVLAIKWNKKGDLLLTGSKDMTAVIWDATNGDCRQQFEFHIGPIFDVDWKDDITFATSSGDQTIFVCQLGMLEPLQQFQGHGGEVNSIKWDPTGTYLASCSDDKTAKVWQLEKDEPFRDFRQHTKEVYSLRWSPTSGLTQRDVVKPRLLATASFDAVVRVWDVDKGTCLYSFAKHTGRVYSVSFSPGGGYLATGSLDGTFKVWSMKNGSLLKNLATPGGTIDVAWNVRGDKLAACFSEFSQVLVAHLPTSSLQVGTNR
ncbi:hypothetical protein SeMB42_g01369 [Synchytrium endobioticum]|uniref:LisH domain-containing protein n=1 Tax=Synchytrium endobioticum TaxID=286115 RepID=A0A507DM67_9FUNG|nr:hypothetical protein SeMB42_g01369 [Synchytrium endobioticum]